MKIGIDISQTAYEKTGVAGYLVHLVEHLVRYDTRNEYILFFSSLRKPIPAFVLKLKNLPHVSYRKFPFPPSILSLLWNTLHILPIEKCIGPVDFFITSDWTEPPAVSAKKMTILYDLSVYTYPQETDTKIVATQKKKLQWVKKESDKIICISDSTRKDAEKILGIETSRLVVIYPGI